MQTHVNYHIIMHS